MKNKLVDSVEVDQTTKIQTIPVEVTHVVPLLASRR